MFKQILCAFDGSEHAEAALGLACDMALKYRAKLSVVSIPQTIPETLIVGYGAVPVPPSQAEIERAANDIKSRAQAIVELHKAIVPDYHIKTGEPGRVIVDVAKAIEADLIIMGRRGMGNLGGLLVGSTTNRVSQLADCAVLTLK